jgi:hypothetical protein
MLLHVNSVGKNSEVFDQFILQLLSAQFYRMLTFLCTSHYLNEFFIFTVYCKFDKT